MEKEHRTKIDIVKIQMVRDGTLDYGKKAIKGPQDLADLGHKFIENADREMFLLVCLNTRNHINCIHVVSIGTVNTSLVSPREVLKAAILSNASSVAFIHNHPSGDPDPSDDDIKITNRLVECGKLFGIELLDHVIISDDGKYHSFMERGLISHDSNPLPPQIKEKDKTLSEQCGSRYEIDRIEEGKDYADFGKQYFKVTGHTKGPKKKGTIPEPARFKEFTALMRETGFAGNRRILQGSSLQETTCSHNRRRHGRRTAHPFRTRRPRKENHQVQK